ncbi:3-ketoacyl-ACP reductase, partial [Pirellulales bacterium]|nr:3-ketoacyl-ACP reductase [Pirellulales bacterium]
MPPSQQRVALITGGSRGIGFGIAKALAAEGWRLAINGRRPAADVQEPLDELRSTGVDAIYCAGDVASDEDRAGMLAAIRSEFGRLDLLVNNAGITSPGRRDLLEATEDSFDKVFDVNLKGPFFLSQAAAKWMIEQREADPDYAGVIVNISSVSAEIVSINRGDYCMARAATTMMTRLWAARLAESGIAVYEVMPGVIRTDMTAGVTEKYDRMIADGLTAERRWGEPEDVARCVAMLARGELSYATGNVFHIDGGLL